MVWVGGCGAFVEIFRRGINVEAEILNKDLTFDGLTVGIR